MAVKYQPVVRATSGHYFGAAWVGTHSAVIGWNMDDPALRKDLLGFAVRRTDINPNTGEIMRLNWLGGYKRFAETDDGRAEDVSSLEAPFQRFRWNDYTLNADLAYRYDVFPMRGKPGALTRDEAPLTFDIRPSYEDPGGDEMGVFVNRGVTSAMAYMARYKNQHPSEVADGAAYAWLSRGLKESLLDFMANSKAGDGLHVAIYEFFDHQIAQALKDARDRGVDVQIAYDHSAGKHSTDKSIEALKHFHLDDIALPRTNVAISHNKVVIRLVGGIAHEVWTGSANFSENAFNYQTNTALIIREAGVVQNYEDYFQALKSDPKKKDSKKANRALMDRINAVGERLAAKTFFSPISQTDILQSSADLISSAKSAFLISAPFGMDKTMIAAMQGNPSKIIEYGLVNSTVKRKIEGLRRHNTQFYPPKRLETYMGRTWDAKAFGAHKIHAKTIITDPFGDNPKIFIGSANFSKASCSNNDENALLIEGDKRLTAIIGTEFLRMFDHYKSRFYIHHDKITLHLKSDDSWSKTAFDPDTKRSRKFRDRVVFSGQE